MNDDLNVQSDFEKEKQCLIEKLKEEYRNYEIPEALERLKKKYENLLKGT